MSTSDSGGLRGFLKDCFEGLLEGHESPCFKFLYRAFTGSVFLLAIISAILPITTLENENSFKMAPLHAVMQLGLLITLMILIRWYRTDGMASKMKRLIYFLAALLICSSVTAISMYIVATEEPPPEPTPCPACPAIPCGVVIPDVKCADARLVAQCTVRLAPCPTPAPTTLPPQRPPIYVPPPGPPPHVDFSE